MPKYFTSFFKAGLNPLAKDSIAEMKKELKARGHNLKKHTFGYWEIYDKDGEQIGLIDDYNKYCNTINKMNSF